MLVVLAIQAVAAFNGRVGTSVPLYLVATMYNVMGATPSFVLHLKVGWLRGSNSLKSETRCRFSSILERNNTETNRHPVTGKAWFLFGVKASFQIFLLICLLRAIIAC